MSFVLKCAAVGGLLAYLQRTDRDAYLKLIAELGLRK